MKPSKLDSRPLHSPAAGNPAQTDEAVEPNHLDGLTLTLHGVIGSPGRARQVIVKVLNGKVCSVILGGVEPYIVARNRALTALELTSAGTA